MEKIEWDKVKTRLEALLVIDEYQTDPDKNWLRLIVKSEESYGIRYLIDNGSGDSLDVIFTDKMILVKGFDHESNLSQFAADEWNQDVIDGFYKGLDEKYQNLYSEEKKMKQPSLSGMTVKSIKIRTKIRIRMVENGYYPISLKVLSGFMSL